MSSLQKCRIVVTLIQEKIPINFYSKNLQSQEVISRWKFNVNISPFTNQLLTNKLYLFYNCSTLPQNKTLRKYRAHVICLIHFYEVLTYTSGILFRLKRGSVQLQKCCTKIKIYITGIFAFSDYFNAFSTLGGMPFVKAIK